MLGASRVLAGAAMAVSGFGVLLSIALARLDAFAVCLLALAAASAAHEHTNRG